MTIQTMDQLVAGLAGGFRASFYKAAPVLSAAYSWGSLWTVAGQPGAGATPPTGAGEAPTNGTPGALLFTNPATGNSYLAGAEAAVGASAMAALYLFDRLVHTSGLSGTVTTAQAVNSAAITRPDANGAGTELFLECYGNLGASSAVATVSYTNQSGVAGQLGTATVPINAKTGQLIPVALATGDTGVRSVQSVTLANTTGTAGNFGITIGRRLGVVAVPVAAGAGTAQDPFTLGLPQISNGACLWLVAVGANNSSPGPVNGMIAVAQG